MSDTPKPTAPVYREYPWRPRNRDTRPVEERLATETQRLAANRLELQQQMQTWAAGNEHEGPQQQWQLVLDAALIALAADAQTIADTDIEIARLSRIESAEHAAWMDECRAKLDEHATYLAEHDEKPDMYLGHPPPGASPSFYGPDDVVVDGDWLAQLEVNYTFATRRVEELEAAVAER
jgi:hypothetical protein